MQEPSRHTYSKFIFVGTSSPEKPFGDSPVFPVRDNIYHIVFFVIDRFSVKGDEKSSLQLIPLQKFQKNLYILSIYFFLYLDLNGQNLLVLGSARMGTSIRI